MKEMSINAWMVGVELEAAGELPISIMRALVQLPPAALPLAEVMDAACAAHLATRLSVDPLAQRRIAGAAVDTLGACSMAALQLRDTAGGEEPARLNPVSCGAGSPPRLYRLRKALNPTALGAQCNRQMEKTLFCMVVVLEVE